MSQEPFIKVLPQAGSTTEYKEQILKVGLWVKKTDDIGNL
jgi:hypothetical protein